MLDETGRAYRRQAETLSFDSPQARRQVATRRLTTSWRARFFSTVSTPRILQRSRFRRGLASAQWSWASSNANDSGALDRRGELLLRVLHLDRVRDLRPALRVRVSRVARPRDHHRLDLRRDGHFSDGESGAPQQGRRVPRVPGARVALHSAPTEARAPRTRVIALPPFPRRFYPALSRPFCGLLP
jgi:hypothetical protein